MSLLKTSKIQMALVLIVFAIWSITTLPSLPTILQILIAIGGCVLTDVLFVKIRKTPLFLPSAALVSGLIIGLISSPHMYEYAAIASILAMTVKNIIRISSRHIFNPAASGLLISSIVFNQPVSWIAAPLYLFIFPAYVSLVRIRRYYTIIVFLIMYVVSLILLNPPGIQNTTYFILNTVFDPTILFFSLVMLPEPMTSPSHFKKQLLFGFLVAVLVMGISLLAIPIDPLLTSLLLANAVFFKFR